MRLGRRRGAEAQRFGGHQVHAADRALAGLVADDLRMHRADPFPRQPVVDDLAVFVEHGADGGAGEHARLEPAVPVGEVDPDRDGAGLGVEHGADVGDDAAKRFPRRRIGAELHLLPVVNQRQVHLVHVEDQPEAAQVGDAEQPFFLVEILPFDHVFLDDRAVDGGVDGEQVRDGSALADFLDLFRREAPLAHFVLDRFERVVAGILEFGEIFVLHHREVGAEHLGDVFAAMGDHAGVVDVELVDPAGKAQRDVGDAALIVIDAAVEGEFGGDEFPFDFRRPHVRQFLGVRRQLQDRGRRMRPGCLGLERNQVHMTDRALAGAGQPDLRMHRAGPQRFGRFFRGGRRRVLMFSFSGEGRRKHGRQAERKQLFDHKNSLSSNG